MVHRPRGDESSPGSSIRSILEAGGREDVCGVCGEFPAEDLKIVGPDPPLLASIRLCKRCQAVRASYVGESFGPLL